MGVLVLGLTVAGVAALAAPREDPTAHLPTATVQRGFLEATVTASGNIESGATASLQMRGAGGIVAKVYVATGQQVSRGDKLVRVDDTDARAQLESALVALDSAEASLQTTTQGRTSAERQADAAAIAAAEQNLKNAERSLAAAQDNYDLVKDQQAELVGIARDAADAAQRVVDLGREQLAALEQQLSATDPADAAAIAALEAQIAQVESQLAIDKATLKTADASLAQAKRTRDTALQQARQSLTSQTGSRDAAKKSLAQQKATVAVNQQGPKPGNVDAANAQVESAQLQVDKARQAIEDTVLVAPFDGVVSTVNAVVGQSSATVVASATGASGLVVLVNPEGLRVTAAIAEADATAVQVGQPATVNLPASGIDMSGEVIAVNIASTVSNNVVQYLTTVSLTDPPAEVRVGQTSSLSIITGSEEDALFVPTSAITVDGASSYVTRLADGVQTRVEVTTGMVGTTGTQILSGLAEGDIVVLPSTGGAASLPFPAAGGSTGQ